MLIAIDASPEARAAAVCGGALCARLGATAILLHVSDRSPVAIPPWERPDHQTAYSHDEVRPLLAEYAGLLKDAGCSDVAVDVRLGQAASVIAETAADFGVDLIVLGRRGLGDAEGLVLGSVSHEVEHLVACPVMTVTDQAPTCRMDNILLAVDDSDHAGRAADIAGELAAASDARLTIMYVMTEMSSPAAGTELAGRVEYQRIESREAEERRAVGILERAARRAQNRGAMNVERIIESGRPARVISRLAREIDADAVCLGRRGLGSVGALLRRSTSHRVGKDLPGTVITAK
jgi:nucleotide-binding universal stress UspA family protein